MAIRIPKELIKELSEDLEPVTPIWPPRRRAVIWLVFCFLLSIALIALTGQMRTGFIELAINNTRFSLEFFSGLLAGIIAAFYASEMMVPGRHWSNFDRLLSILPLLIYLGFILYSFISPPIQPSWEAWRFGCERDIILFSLAPMALFFIIGMRSATEDGRWVGLLIAIASAAPAAAMMQLACMYQPWHTLAFHFGPILLVGLITVSLGRFFLRIR